MSNDLIQKQDVVKEHFGWEVPVEVVPLPSRGMVYGPDSPLHSREMVEIKSIVELQNRAGEKFNILSVIK